MARVLMAEAEERLVALVAEALRGDGHVVETAGGNEVIVLDVTLTGIDDLTICRRLRDAGGWAAVLLLSTPSGERTRRRTATSSTSISITCGPR